MRVRLPPRVPMKAWQFLIIFLVSCYDSSQLHYVEENVICPEYEETVTILTPTVTEDLRVWLEFAQLSSGLGPHAKKARFLLEDLTHETTLDTPILNLGDTFGPLTLKDVEIIYDSTEPGNRDKIFVITYCLTRQ